MRKLHLVKWAAIFFTASLFIACSDDEKKEEVKVPIGTQSVKELVSKGFGAWRYYSFEKGFNKMVGTGSTDPVKGDDAKWAKRTDWDIAFNRYQIRTNSGVSGVGKGGVFIVKEMATMKDFLNLKKASKNDYKADEKHEILITMPPKEPKPRVGMSVASKWVEIGMQKPGQYTTKITPTLFVLKTAKGQYVKIYMKNYKNAKGENGYISFDYVYQKDGSTSF